MRPGRQHRCDTETLLQLVEPGAVSAGSFETVHNNPQIVLVVQNRPAMHAFARMSLVTIVLAGAQHPIPCTSKRRSLAFVR